MDQIKLFGKNEFSVETGVFNDFFFPSRSKIDHTTITSFGADNYFCGRIQIKFTHLFNSQGMIKPVHIFGFKMAII